MKSWIILISVFLLLITGCQRQQKEYPDVKIAQVIQELKRGNNFNEVKGRLEKKYGLKYNKEIRQSKNEGKVYEFLGGKLEGIVTQSWVVIFEKDSLVDVIVKAESETREQNAGSFKRLKEQITELAYDKSAKVENEWSIHERGQIICNIQLMDSMGKGIILGLYM